MDSIVLSVPGPKHHTDGVGMFIDLYVRMQKLVAGKGPLARAEAMQI